MLAMSWCDISEDQVKGKDQSKDQFWERITARFCKVMKKSPTYRTHNQCNSKWANMNKVVMQLNEIYTNYYNQPRSGENEASIWKKTKDTFHQDTNGAFKFEHVWELV